ncbi:bifunctional nicotinamidase/pyrazinamidase [Martelella lutilitoris]|uniref:Nicotinamidase n=1 Tax=Martelella lutilitoris TaxID=2583532 RepID=A0A5C4JS87_9HYPH|nr:bifunctional nicotinamidase/pyrazinamidase [Martelella lutilitoris]TNB48325.1 bifunctional nicotinamidase/pyrazinamidase [Martelella lutilitoris]
MKALLLVDIQNGFCPGGNLAVADGDAVVPVANLLIRDGGYDIIAASQDWHPEGHGSFASVHPDKKPFDMGELDGKPQVMWPDHCVQNTEDAAFHPDLDIAAVDYIQRKGENPEIDSYSAFRDNEHHAVTGLADYLKQKGVTTLDITGLALDFCVRFTAVDAREMLPGVTVRVILEGCRGISEDGVEAALAEMREAGVELIDLRTAIED